MVDAVKVLLAKKETTYGTDATPTVGANAILTRNFSTKPVEVDRVERNLDQRIYGARASVPSNERQTMGFEVELAGSGSAGTAPGWMELLEACGMAPPVLTASTSAVQNFAAPGTTPSSLTMHHWMADQRRRSVGNVGSFTLDLSAGNYPFMGFTYMGLLGATPFDKSLPAATDLTRWKQPVEVNDANTDVTLDGYAVVMKSLQLNGNVTTAMRNLVNSRYVRRGGHTLSGTMMVEAVDIAARDYLATLRSGALIALALQHGTVAGNIIQLAAAKVQITDITESEEDEILMWSLAITLTVDGGSPDLTITAR
jgi:hypothetical protein